MHKTLPTKLQSPETLSPRPSGRGANELRPISLETGVNAYAEGSCLIKFGNTHVLCTASTENKVPMWMRGKGEGWITAEYGMLPRATHQRVDREATRGKQGGRTLEIQRLIGRSIRSVVDLRKLGEKTIWLDCDVLQADGGTRTAAITGAFVATHIALQKMITAKQLDALPITDYVAAISCGITESGAVLDLDYAEDSTAIADANFVLTGLGGVVEVQATAEKTPIAREQLDAMLALAQKGIQQLVTLQKQALEAAK